MRLAMQRMLGITGKPASDFVAIFDKTNLSSLRQANRTCESSWWERVQALDVPVNGQIEIKTTITTGHIL